MEPVGFSNPITRSAVEHTEDEKLKSACRDFESLLISALMKAMRATVPKSDFFGSEKSEAVFRDMLDSEIAAVSARRGDLGVAQTLYRELSRSGFKNTEPGVDK